MDYVSEGDTVVVRLDPGEQVFDSLAAVRDELNTEHDFLTGIGTVNTVVFGHCDMDGQEHLEEEFTGQLEVMSLLGNISPDRIHTHTQVGTRDLEILGGYCSGTRVSGTFGVVIHLNGTSLAHHLDERVSLNVFDI